MERADFNSANFDPKQMAKLIEKGVDRFNRDE
jgi:hypothetical protein